MSWLMRYSHSANGMRRALDIEPSHVCEVAHWPDKFASVLPAIARPASQRDIPRGVISPICTRDDPINCPIAVGRSAILAFIGKSGPEQPQKALRSLGSKTPITDCALFLSIARDIMSKAPRCRASIRKPSASATWGFLIDNWGKVCMLRVHLACFRFASVALRFLVAASRFFRQMAPECWTHSRAGLSSQQTPTPQRFELLLFPQRGLLTHYGLSENV